MLIASPYAAAISNARLRLLILLLMMREAGRQARYNRVLITPRIIIILVSNI